jgi:hypothetical protein
VSPQAGPSSLPAGRSTRNNPLAAPPSTAPAKRSARSTGPVSAPPPATAALDEDDEDISTGLDTSAALATKRFMASQNFKNKENRPLQTGAGLKRSFNAPQSHAQKVTWGGDSQEAYDSPPPMDQTTNPRVSKKARLEVEEEGIDEVEALEEDDVSEDEGFETAPTDPAQVRKRRAEVPAYVPAQRDSTTSLAVRTETAATSSPRPNASLQAPAPTSRPTHQPGGVTTITQHSPSSSTSESSEDVVYSAAQLTEVRETAREYVASLAPRPTQQRTFWTSAQEARFVELIEKWGCAWSAISKLSDPVLANKGTDQVGLKDKARNLKMGFLK